MAPRRPKREPRKPKRASPVGSRPSPHLARPMLSAEQVTELLTISRSTLWRLVRSGAFPKAVSITERRVRWFEDEVRRWQEARAAM
jgi:prophage regulatory protein